MSDELNARILVVEDEPAIRELVRLHLTVAGYVVEESGDGQTALVRARAEPFAAIVLDLMLPDVDGISVCRAVRGTGMNQDTPILMLTARDTESDKVLGLESGADDYLAKPFGVRELVARVRAVLRRRRAAPSSDRLDTRHVHTHEIDLDLDRREAVVRGVPIELTRQEFDLLVLLASRPGIVFSRAALLAKVWNGDVYVTERTVDTVVSRVRRKIEQDPQDPELILTAWGVGYKFVDVDI